MPDSEKLLAAIEEREDSAYGSESDSTSVERSRAIDYYLGRPFGNEVEGRSQIVSKDVSDTIEWIKPSLMNIFAGGEQVCQFDPVGPEDEEAASQETDYVNYVIQKKNGWFSVAYTWFTDALLTRNAYALAYWDERQDSTLERYQGLTDDAMAMLAQDGEVEIVAHTANQQQVLGPQGPVMATLHDVEVRRVAGHGCVRIEVLPPERCLIAENARSMSVRDAEFFEFWDYKTVSWLRENGFDVPEDLDDSGSVSETLIDQARDIDRQSSAFDTDRLVDPAMRKVKVRMVWIRHDYDEDGISELNYCVVVGSHVLWREEVSGIPVAAIVPTPFPHRHMGLSVYDSIADIQIIKSAMLRQVVDNTYLQNNGRYGISDKVNLDDMLTSRPGGIVRVKGGMPGNEIVPLNHPFIAERAINVIEYIDQIRQNRTGTSQYFTGVDQNALNKTASGIAQLSSAAAQRVELIARVFAEGVKELFLIVHELTLKHSTAEEKIKLRGKWSLVDPRQWKKRYDMTISVGLGAGNRQAQLGALRSIIELQGSALQMGLATPGNLFNALTEYTKAAGFTSAERFWNDPEQNPPPQKEPDPQLMIEAERVKIERERVDLERAKVAASEERERMGMQLKAQHLAETRAQGERNIQADLEKALISSQTQKDLKGMDVISKERLEEFRSKPSAVVQVSADEKFAEVASAAMQKVAETSAQGAEAIMQAAAMMSEVAERMSKPKTIIRDKSGKAVGVQ